MSPDMENTKRLVSLDVFRGLTIALMIIVNNPGNWGTVYPPLLHSAWSGCTPTDLVFPFFMFIIGTAMWYSNKKFDHSLPAPLVFKILRRAAIIYLIGISLNAFSTYKLDFSTIRIMGVLPRIALGYLAASFLVPLLSASWIKIVSAMILLLYWALLVIFGGDTPFSLEGNFARSFDIAVLGINHIPVFHGVKFDQTGLLSTLPSIVNILLGYLAGRLIDTAEIKLDAAKKLILWGIAGIGIGLVWNLIFPINKPLWTSSFVLYTCGFASMLLGLLLWIIDIRGYSRWANPFRVFGVNPLFLYVFSEVVAISFGLEVARLASGETTSVTNWIYTSLFLQLASPVNASLLYALAFVVVCWVAGLILFRRKIYIRL
jgi:predicted acyltransferase